MKETIYMGSDHAGFELKNILKQFLVKKGYKVEDAGPDQYDPDDDYPDYASKVCQKVLTAKTKGRGILICGSGQGMSIAANKFKGIRAAVCYNKDSAKQAREHLDANIICLGANMVSAKLTREIMTVWLKMPFSCENRHRRRLDKIKKLSTAAGF